VKVLVVSGIWPPDPGGPASHASALADFLHERGHAVEVVTTADAQPAPRPYPVRWVERTSSTRHGRCTLLVRRAALGADVVYATSMVRRAAVGARLTGRPLVVKLVSDEVFERMQREGRYAGSLEAFQGVHGGARLRFLRATRDRALRGARRVLSPSEFLRGLAVGWGVDPGRIDVVPNAVPPIPELPPRDELRAELALAGNVLAFAGRLGIQKSLHVALEAVAAVPDVTLAIAGDGPEREPLERRAAQLGLDGRARFLGRLPRDGVLRLYRAADAALLSSSWENFPHSVVEALAVGTPVIATAVGGVPEVVRDGENGLLAPAGDAGALAAAVVRFFGDRELRERLAAASPGSVAGYSEEAVFTRVAGVLERVAAES